MLGRSPDNEGGNAGGFGGKLQPPRRRQRYAVEFADNARKAAHAQPFLHGRQDFGVLPGFAEDDAVGMKPDARERGREQIAAVQAPENRAGQPRKNARSEKQSAGGVATPRAVLAEFMHGTKGKAAARKRLVHPLMPNGSTGVVRTSPRLSIIRRSSANGIEMIWPRLP